MRTLPLIAVLLTVSSPALAQSDVTNDPAATQPSAAPAWAFEESDIPVDPDFVFGTLPNGMRYIIRENATPEGTALVRLRIGSGSLSETETERGLAHFLEHMAFNGSANVPEGEMVRLLEREGLAFGADTNASTGFEETIYKLNLPRNDEDLLDTALMLMRETASELTIDPGAVDRERGIIMAERRDRRNYAQRELEDRFAFTSPGARYTERLPIGTEEILQTADADDLRGFYAREYVPANTALVVVGDFNAALVEAKIRERFADWRAAPKPAEARTGPVDITRSGLNDIYIDPALNESLTISRLGAWHDEPDNIATRQRNLMRSAGYAIVNRRLQRLARGDNAPFNSAGYGTGDVFEDARTTRLVVATPDGDWRRGLVATGAVLREALQYGFTQAEVDEQIAGIRTAQRNAVASADTRSNGALTSRALGLVSSDVVPSTPQSSLDRFETIAPQVTPANVLAAMQADAITLHNPMIRFRGRVFPEGGEIALREAWAEVMASEIATPESAVIAEFAYQDFGAPGQIIEDVVDERLGIRSIRFANGVRLNLKPTDLSEDRVSFRVAIDGGWLIDTKDNPLATAMVSRMADGGLGRHSADELQSILAGRSVSLGVRIGSDQFTMSGTTTTGDLELQLQLLTAGITDPGYRTVAEQRYHRAMREYFANLDATPGKALSVASGGIISDNDPRFTLQNREAYLALDFAKLRADIGDRLSDGAIEIGLVGDFNPELAIASVATTFGALPTRESDFQLREAARLRSFTADRTPRRLTHSGEDDQALLRLIWPTTDDSDQALDIRLELLERIVRLRLTEELRERLGQAYSPSASSNTSSVFTDYGTFSLTAALDLASVDTARAAMLDVVAKLRREAASDDELARARQPLIESYDNLLKTNGGWLRLVDRAQSQSDRIDDYLRAPDLVAAVTPQDILEAARTYLDPDQALEILVSPKSDNEQDGAPDTP